MTNTIDFSKGLIPAIIQDALSKNVLMLGYMNEEALNITRQTGQVTFYSRSKDRLWTKGETSGNHLKVVSIRPDCDGDTLLILAHPAGPVCHTGSATCFTETNVSNDLSFLTETIRDRIQNPSPESYTHRLMESGINKIAQKVGEEAVELVIEAKDDDAELFLNEAADLIYHYLVLLEAKEKTLSDVIKVLQSRHGDR